MEQLGDNNTWGYCGLGEMGSGLTVRITGKPDRIKGYQIVIKSAVSRIIPLVYVHRYKVHKHPTIFGK